MIEIFSPIFHLALNSFLVFVALALTIEGILRLLRIKNSRARYICRLIPIAKLPIDLFLYLFVERHFFYNVNPFSCETYLLNWAVKWLALPAAQYNSIPHFLVRQLPEAAVVAFLALFLSITSTLFLFRLRDILRRRKMLQEIYKEALPCQRAIVHEKLAQELKGVEILTSNKVMSPCITAKKKILFPEKMAQALPQEEFEAIIAHELEHRRWRDPEVKMGAYLIGAIFWWIPTSSWLKKMELDQEMGCDAAVTRLGVEPLPLAQGILRVVRSSQMTGEPMHSLCHAVVPHTLKRRIQVLLNDDPAAYKRFQKRVLIGMMLSGAASLTIWMC